MLEANVSPIFRNKIDDGVFNFDVVLITTDKLFSLLIGYCVVNTKTNNFYVNVNASVTMSNVETKMIGEIALEDAKKLENVVLS